MRTLRARAIALQLLLLAGGAAIGQVDTSAVSNTMPTANFGFMLPSRLGTLSYSLTGSEMVSTAYSGGSLYESTVGSGNLAYLSNSERDPFSAVISGGYLFNTGSSGVGSSGFADVAASQVYRTRAWVFVVSDGFSYLPQSPTTGFSGVPGLGDIGIPPVQTGAGPDQTILTNSGQRISNGLSGSATWQLTGSTDLQGSGSWQILHFVGNSIPGLDTSDYMFSFGPDHRIDARTSVSANAYYSRQTYPNYQNAHIETEGVNVGFSHAWTRTISTTISAGPETSHGRTIIDIPAQVSVAASAEMSYAGRRNGGSVSYVRAVNGGSGVIFGAISDTASVAINHPLSRDWNFGVSGAYSHSVGLAPIFGETPTTNTIYGGAQASRKLSESLSVYVSYTAQHQSASGFSPLLQLFGFSNAYTGFNNTGAVGITFAPAPLNRGR